MTANEQLLDALAADQDGFWTSLWMIDACDGDMNAARMLARLMFWFKKGKDGEPRARIMRKGRRWVAKRHDDWWDEIRLSEFQAKRAAAKLTALGLAESEHFMFSGMRTVHYCLNADEIARAVSANPRRPKVSADLRLPESAESDQPCTGDTAQEVAQEITPRVATATADAGAALDAGSPPHLNDGPAVRTDSDQPGKVAKNGRASKPAGKNGVGAAPRVPLGDGCQLYRDIMKRTPNDNQRPVLDAAHAEHGADRMREALTWWSMHGYNPGNVPDMLSVLANGADRAPANGYARNGRGRAEPDFSQVIL